MDGISSLSDFTSDILFSVISAILNRIFETDDEFPSKSPNSMSEKYNLGTKMSTRITQLGFTGEIGYQTFLYNSSGAKDVRYLISFLLEKIPNLEEEEDEITSPKEKLINDIKLKLNSEIKKPWIPFSGLSTYEEDFITSEISFQDRNFNQTKLSKQQIKNYFLTRLPSDKLMTSVINYHSNILNFENGGNRLKNWDELLIDKLKMNVANQDFTGFPSCSQEESNSSLDEKMVPTQLLENPQNKDVGKIDVDQMKQQKIEELTEIKSKLQEDISNNQVINLRYYFYSYLLNFNVFS